MSSLFLLAGEASGDLLGAQLIRSFKQLAPKSDLFGVGGPKMRSQDFHCMGRMEDYQLMGLKEIVLQFPRVAKQFFDVRNAILSKRPDGVVLIDYPGFNLRLAKSLRKKGYKGPIIQYVSPTVWVWGKGRIHTLAKHYDLLLTILPFENVCYQETTLAAQYVGSPVLESVKKYQCAPQPLVRREKTKLLAVFPGSRKTEIINNCSLQLRVAQKIAEKTPLTVAVSCAQELYRPLIEHMIGKSGLKNVRIIEEDKTYALMEACDAALAKSGTVTLELALFQKPTAVVYQVDAFNRFCAKHILRIKTPHVALANIIAGKRVQPEFVIEPFTEDELVKTVTELLFDPEIRRKCQDEYKALEDMIGNKAASQEAARAILRQLKGRHESDFPI